MVTRNVFRLTCLSVMLLGVIGTTGATMIYNFDSTAVGAFGSGTYGSVTLAQNGSDVDVTVLLRDDLNFVNTGGPHAVFSFNAMDVTAGDITNILFNSVANGNFTIVESANNVPFGNFDFLLDCTGSGCQNGAPGQQIDPLTFTVLDAAEADFASLSVGAHPAYFAADVICTSGTCNGATGTVGASNPPPPSVAEPGTMALLGAGLLGFSVTRRRRKS